AELAILNSRIGHACKRRETNG
ncbi:hypothetical protein CCACVL1_04519, partial [Corchorus capsularis]